MWVITKKVTWCSACLVVEYRSVVQVGNLSAIRGKLPTCTTWRASTMQHTDILIIGGGIIGSSIAYHLSLQKLQVLVCERAAVAVEPAASWASAGGVRRQGRDPAEAALASEAIARWP